MAGAIMNKVWNLFGIDPGDAEDLEDEDVYDYEYEEEEPEVEEKRSFIRRNKVVPMTQQSIKMVISQPTSFEQSEEICGFLKEKKSVIVNLEYVN